MQRVLAGVLQVRSNALGVCGICSGGPYDEDVESCIPIAKGGYEVALSQVRWTDTRFREVGEMRGVAAVTLESPHTAAERWSLWSGPEGPSHVILDYGIGAVFDVADGPVAHTLCEGTGHFVVEPLFEYTTDPWYLWHDDVLAFRGGRGDGAYDVWIGYDHSDRTVAIAIDLELLKTAKS